MTEELQQKIKQVSLKNEDLTLSPEFIREIYSSNYYQNSLSLMVGWTGDRTKLLRSTIGGVLKTAPIATGLEEYKSETDTLAADDFVEVIRDNTTPYARWDILIDTKDAIIEFRDKVNVAWGNEIILTVGWHSLDLVSNGVHIKNRTGGNNSTYQITGYR